MALVCGVFMVELLDRALYNCVSGGNDSWSVPVTFTGVALVGMAVCAHLVRQCVLYHRL